MNDLRNGLAGSSFREGSATVSVRPSIDGKILEKEGDSEDLRARITVSHNFSYAVSRSVTERQETDGGDVGDAYGVDDGAASGFDVPIGEDVPGIGEPETASTREINVHRDDNFEEAVHLVFRDGQWVCEEKVELKSLQMAIDHALRAQ